MSDHSSTTELKIGSNSPVQMQKRKVLNVISVSCLSLCRCPVSAAGLCISLKLWSPSPVVKAGPSVHINKPSEQPSKGNNCVYQLLITTADRKQELLQAWHVHQRYYMFKSITHQQARVFLLMGWAEQWALKLHKHVNVWICSASLKRSTVAFSWSPTY